MEAANEKASASPGGTKRRGPRGVGASGAEFGGRFEPRLDPRGLEPGTFGLEPRTCGRRGD